MSDYTDKLEDQMAERFREGGDMAELSRYPVPEESSARVKKNRRVENEMIRIIEDLLRGEKQ